MPATTPHTAAPPHRPWRRWLAAALALAALRAVVLLCMVIPITVSGLGLREASLTAVLALYGVDEQLALAQSLLFFAAIVFVKGLIGGMFELKDALAPQRSRHDLS